MNRMSSGIQSGNTISLFIFAFWILSGAWGGGNSPAMAEERSKGVQSDLIYVSDYFSFVGSDDQGHVAFALDNNRGKDGKEYQAEHFAVMHDEDQGWIHLGGSGDYPNVNRELMRIPDSEFFQFEGTPAEGVSVRSPPNDLILKIDPLPDLVIRTEDSSTFRMGSAPGILTWKGRTLKGRVIYEFIYKTDFNRLSRTYFGLWKDFQGFYLFVGGGGDFYLHSHQNERMGPLVGSLLGFSVFDGEFEPLENVELDVIKRELTWGFYRWPTEWRITWERPKGTGSMILDLQEKNVIGNWIIGGFAMGIVAGEIEYNGERRSYYGLAELLM